MPFSPTNTQEVAVVTLLSLLATIGFYQLFQHQVHIYLAALLLIIFWGTPRFAFKRRGLTRIVAMALSIGVLAGGLVAVFLYKQ